MSDPQRTFLALAIAVLGFGLPSGMAQETAPSAAPNEKAGEAPQQSTPVGTEEKDGFRAEPMWTAEQSPIDFLDLVSQHAKARWRQLYRPPPPTPPPDRSRAAITLGFLIGEGFLSIQAGDSQQFRNNNQEITTYCRTLGLGEKVSARLMTLAKMAEAGEWDELKVEAVAAMADLIGTLEAQHDEDLAVLVKLGVWIRTLEVVSTVLVETPEADIRGLCVGSPSLLKDLRESFGGISEGVRKEEVVIEMGNLLDYLWRHWSNSDTERPPPEVVIKTQEKLANAARKLSLK